MRSTYKLQVLAYNLVIGSQLVKEIDIIILWNNIIQACDLCFGKIRSIYQRYN